MRLLWLLLALAAVAAPVAFADDVNVESAEVAAGPSDWRAKAIEFLKKAIERLEEVIAKLPEGSKLKAILSKTLDYLRKKLTDLQDAEISFNEVNRAGIVQKIIDSLEEAASKLPDGAAKDRLQQTINRIRELLNSIKPSDYVEYTPRLRELVDKIRNLIDAHKRISKEALLKFLNSDTLEMLVSQLVEPIQSAVRERIAKLKERLESVVSMAGGNWREKVIEFLQKAIDRLQEVIAKLPEGSKLKPILSKTLDYLRKKLNDLQDPKETFTEFDRAEFLKRVLARLEDVASKLPEGAAKERLQKAIERIREALEKLKPDSGAFELVEEKSDNEKEIERLKNLVANLESVIENLPEDNKLLPHLKRQLERLQKRLEELEKSN